MKLRRGITGFSQGNEPELPVCDLRAFRTHCHAAARAVGGRVVQERFWLEGAVTNFATVAVEASGEMLAVLLNHYFPVVGFAVPARQGDSVPGRFVDAERLAELLRGTGAYEVLSRAELERPVFKEDLEPLSPAEMKQVRYWRPRRIGDIVFNFWD